MILRLFLPRILVLLLLSGLASAGLAQEKRAAKAAAADDAMLAAHAAFRAGDTLRLARVSAGMEKHVLAPYLEYWRLKLRLEERPQAEIQSFLQAQAGSYLADRLRADWLKVLGKRGEWQAFERELGPLVNDDLEIRCYGWIARLERDDTSAFEEARVIWGEPKELPEGCVALAGRKVGAGEAGPDVVWQRLRLLLENGQMGAARRAFTHLPAGEVPYERLLSLATATPQKLLAHPPGALERRAVREMVLLAFSRLARNDPTAAAEALRGQVGARLSDADRRYLWGRIGYEASRRLQSEGLAWFKQARGAAMSDEQLAWKVRAALRAADWQAVRDAIDPMSALARQDPTWSYWYGRALGAQGNLEGARAYFMRISGQPNFYGLLAAEELGYAPTPPQPFHVASADEVAAAARNPGLVRALELYRLGLRTEGTREWFFTIRAMEDMQLLAAAELARRHDIHDRVINTADRTALTHNFKFRYLAPYRDVFREQARVFDIEEAWVLGLVRQESRFIVNAKSSAGAQGLMQLMPATAKWVASRVGLNYSPARVVEVDTNVVLGTRYLKMVLDDLGHPVLASAAYNAGPGRARRWRDAKPLEGAIYAESIPFNETRDYVKRVMANTVFYAHLYGGNPMPLKDRLGIIPARAATDRFNENLP
ncbi:MAG: lytic transglycosylase domain-containing protein [Betaproteobacteria bacterium]|nr:lytic transglycosylase domain-containing protein [Betaproteobacteria bacterium]